MLFSPLSNLQTWYNLEFKSFEAHKMTSKQSFKNRGVSAVLYMQLKVFQKKQQTYLKLDDANTELPKFEKKKQLTHSGLDICKIDNAQIQVVFTNI